MTVLVVGYLAYRYGRIYCNTVCPVGTLLGFYFEVFPFLKYISIPLSVTVAGCVPVNVRLPALIVKKHEIDYSRCVVCFDCIDNCRQGAISYTLRYKKESQKNISSDEPDISKRTFCRNSDRCCINSTEVSTMSQSVGVLTGNKPYKKEHPLSPRDRSVQSILTSIVRLVIFV